MEDIKRMMMECRYILSLNKTYYDISNILNIDEEMVYNDLNYRLKKYDKKLYNRVKEKLRKVS